SSLAGVVIGVPEKLFFEDCSPGIAEGVEAALAELESHGARRISIELPAPSEVFAMFCEGHLATAAVYGMIRGEFPEWWGTLDAVVRDRLERHGATLPAHGYVCRLRAIEAWMREADTLLSEVDAIATPTVSVTPARVSEVVAADAYRQHNLAASRNAAVIALLGLPALSMPVALDASGMPVGLQLAARRGRDAELIALAWACERQLGTSTQRLGSAPVFSAH